jgi:hypothetical protein
VRLRDLGRGREWAERAANGRRVRIINDEYEPVAYIVPITEPITTELIEWLVTRVATWTESERAKSRAKLNALAAAGWRYMRAQDTFVPTSGM